MKAKKHITPLLFVILTLTGTGPAQAMGGTAILIIAGAMMGSTMMLSGYTAHYENADGHGDRAPRATEEKSVVRESELHIGSATAPSVRSWMSQKYLAVAQPCR